MHRIWIIVFLIFFGFGVGRLALAVDQSSSNYLNIGTTFAPAVKDISSSNYLMTGSIDAIVGLSNSSNFSNRSGVPINDTDPVAAPVCGNGVLESGESCDNGGSNGSCPLTCSTSCTVNSCSAPPPPPPPSSGNSGGGGGGGGGSLPPTDTGAEFSGRAYPLSNVVLLKDGQIAVTTIAGSDGSFSARLTGLQPGSYVFGLYAEDAKGIRSSIFAFPISVTNGTVATIAGIFIAPTISVDKDVVKQGENVSIFGQSAPASDILIQVNSDPIYVKTGADSDGTYLYSFNTGIIENGQHTTKSQASLGGAVSSFSLAANFEVSETGLAKPKPQCTKADLNCDGRVNLVDFSIAAFWYKRPLTATFVPIELERLNGDGKVDIVDFSIMAFYWTG